MSSMSYFRICSMRSIQKTTFCGFIALLNKVLDFGGQLADKFSFILLYGMVWGGEIKTVSYTHLTLPTILRV